MNFTSDMAAESLWLASKGMERSTSSWSKLLKLYIRSSIEPAYICNLCNRCSCPGQHFFFFGGGGNIFGHQCPKNVDLQLFKINIWLKLLQRLKRMLLGSNKYHECSFNVFSLVERGAGNPGRFYHVCKSQPGEFDLSPGIGYFGPPHLWSRQRSGSKNLKLHRTGDLCVTFM